MNKFTPPKKCKDAEHCIHLSPSNKARLCDCYIRWLKKQEKLNERSDSKRKIG